MAEAGRRLDASALREWAHTSVGDLIAHTDEINRLNVFPVADADTGTNMLFTMRAAWAQADAWPDTGDVAQVAAALADGALHGARGNSGVILSQILRGLADVTAEAAAERDGELTEIDGARFGRRAAPRGRAGRGLDGRTGAGNHRLGAAGRRGRGRRRRSPTAPTSADRACRGGRRRGGRTGQDHRATGCARRRRAWSTPAVAVCWCCSTRCRKPCPATRRPARSMCRRRTDVDDAPPPRPLRRASR